jgi:ABC-type dipeptide/oligopeptide/nickel transport system permease component/ABC-type transport system substrate-binding protein
VRKTLALFSAGLVAAAVALVGILYACGAFFAAVRGGETARSETELSALQAGRDMTLSRERRPVLYQKVDYKDALAAWRPKGESPIIAELVRENRLPPLHERVPKDPLVLKGVDGVGAYGGTFYRLANSEADVTTIRWRLAGAGLVRWSPQGYPIVPHLAAKWKSSSDLKVWDFTFRDGLRWSDGHPVTADDVLYWWQQEIQHFDPGIPRFMRVGGHLGSVEKIDELTVRFRFPVPNALFLEKLASVAMDPASWDDFIVPEHYLRQYHPAFGDKAKIESEMRRLKLSSPMSLYKRLKMENNPEHPRLWPWVYHTYRPNPPYIFVRNPYYYAVDTEGNQLPYIDRIVMQIKTPSMIGVSAALGEASMQDRHIRYDDHVLLMSEAERSGYEVYHWYPATRSLFTVFPVLNRRIDPADPSTAKRHALLNERRFRQALSLAIDRRRIIEVEFNGQTQPGQLDAGPDSPYHSAKLLRSYTDYAPQRANALLDELGLVQRDAEGFRTFRDGSRMQFFLDISEFTMPGPAELVVADWAKVGVRVIVRNQARPLFWSRQAGLDHDFTVWTGEGEYMPTVEPRNFVPTYRGAFYAPAFGVWYQHGGTRGDPRALKYGGQEPPADHPFRTTMALLDRLEMTPCPNMRLEFFQQIAAINAEEVWHITPSTPPPQLVVVKKGMRNVPKKAVFGAGYQTPANTGLETYFWDQSNDSLQTQQEIKDSIVNVSRLPGAPVAGSGEGRSRVVLFLVWGSFIGLVALAAIRHPMIWRRLLIIVPTLLVISMLVFAVVRLPPGDFVKVRMVEMEVNGDPASLQHIADLRRDYHLDRGVVYQYLHWLGVFWFGSFSPSDEGLLQGHLGRSMEHNRPVNQVIGDSIFLTILVSVLACLFTWLISVPLGIASAVYRYSKFDYLVRLGSFFGMSVPPFLLALLLIQAGNHWFGVQVTGLFSAEYQAQVEWTFGKMVDLLKHVWLPVLVLGVGGAAQMVRVMRANLLDELGKPYVHAARAKGIRPWRLLLKYPVRVALNPFVSGLGNLFPQLVSGGAIVAMVLSLPMLGPALLSALYTEDTYMAASMLMVLSMLGVFGTLVSDLLLVWLDPRIRMPGSRSANG